MPRTLRVTTPDQIVPDRPQKAVRGRTARIAAYRAQRQAEAPEKPAEPLTAKPVMETMQAPPAEAGPIIWAKTPWYPPRDVIPYCLDQ